MRTITINNIDYTKHLINGYVTNETLTEELDSANIILTCLPKTNFDPFNKVVINENGNYYYFVVDTYVETKISNHHELYEYNMHLISETKVLERFILPNLKITKPKYDSSIKKLGNYLDFILLHYVRPKYYMELDATLKAELNEYQAPEWAWASPSVKQVFNDLLQSIDKPKLVKVKDGIVSAVELSVKGQEIVINKGEIADNNYQASKDYVNHLVIDTKNIIPTSTNVMTAPVVSFRSNDKAYLTNEELELYLANARIEKVDKLLVTLTTKFTRKSDGVKGDETIDIDLTKYIVEETIYNQLLTNERLYHFYYSRGGNTIKGFTYSLKVFGFDATTAINTLLIYEINELNNRISSTGKYDYFVGDLRDLKFTCWFENIGESRIKIYRDELKNHDFALVDNQTSSFINTLAFMQAEREKINRLGNDIRTITWMIKDYDAIPKLNDYIGDYYLASKETAHFGDYYIVKGTLSKDFIQKNLYYGLQSRTRFTNFEMANNSVLRNENLVTNLYFTTENTKPSGTSNRKLVNYIARNYSNYINGVGEDFSKGIKQIQATSTFADRDYKTYFLQPSIYSFDYGVIISLRYYDNINVGMKIDKENIVLGMKFNQKYVSYVDENGELTSVKFELFSRYSTKYRSSGNAYNYDEVYEYPDFIDDYVDEKYLEFTIIDSIYKDNGEILQYDLQFNFIGKDDVVLGTAIGRYNAIADLSSQSSKTNSREDATNLTNLKIYYSTNERYNKGDTSPKGTYNSALKLDATTMIKWQSGILENAIKVSTYSNGQYLNVDTSTWKSWCIATENDELIMAVNRNETTNILSDTIYVTTD